MNGTANLTSRKGAIAGFNVEQLLRRIERRPLSGGGEFRSGRTPYETLTVNLKISQGTATVEEVRMEGPAVRMALGGSASIPARQLDLKGTASLLSTSRAAPIPPRPSFELPFLVEGPWDDPIMLPDVQSRIQRSGAAQPLLDALRNRPPGDPIRSAIERLTCPAGGASPPAASRAGRDRGSAATAPPASAPEAGPGALDHAVRTTCGGASRTPRSRSATCRLASSEAATRPSGHEGDQDGAERVDLRLHAEADLRIDADRQRGGARPGGEARDHQIVEREREGEHPAGGKRRRDQRQRDGEERPQRRAAEIHRRLLQAAVEAHEPRLHHHGDEAHGERGVGEW